MKKSLLLFFLTPVVFVITPNIRTIAQSWSCEDSIIIGHIAGNVAPVTKTVTYGTVTNIPGELSKCWITSNLGADHQATAVDDATEASAGWYWQFNRMQGYMHDGTTRTPNTTWISGIVEDFDWQAANDPCILELGNNWRLPTVSEWSNVSINGGWEDWYGPWNSSLKIHAAGHLLDSDGDMTDRGDWGFYWSSSQRYDHTNGYYLRFTSNYCGNGYNHNSKAYGFSVRCLNDDSSFGLNPDFSGNTLEGIAPLNVQFTDESTGYPTIWKWDFQNDGVYDSFIQNPSFIYSQPGIYSVKLFLENSTEMDSIIKINYVTVTEFWVCGESFTIEHEAGNVAPVTKTVTYNTVSGIAGDTLKCWIASNLGADHQATAMNDGTEESAGWYWQFNRMQGYKHDGTTRIPDTEWITEINEDEDWQAANDPCALELGGHWRIPTFSEWSIVDESGGWTDWNGPWNSPLKLHAAGLLSDLTGSLSTRGQGGYYWSSTQSSNDRSWDLYFYNQMCYMNSTAYKTYGLPIRCLNDEFEISTPEICIVSVTPENHNQVIWEKQPSDQIGTYNMYRETTQTNFYEIIGTVVYEDSSIFVDMSSNPQQRPYKYKISAVFNSGSETDLSNYHRTIHLTINEGPAGWNLIWSPYEGFSFGTYYIYRGSYPDSLSLLDSISGSFTSYSDINPPWGPLYYAIEIVNQAGCFPGKDDGFSKSRSNVQFNGVVGITDNPEDGIRIYPNPAKDKLHIQFVGTEFNAEAEVKIYDIRGNALISKQVRTEKSILNINNLSPGVYTIRISYDHVWLTRKLIVY